MARTGTHYRQGNIMMVAVNALPPGAKPVVPDAAPHSLTLDGADGRSRHVASATAFFRAYGTAGPSGLPEWLEVEGGSLTISHPQHGLLTLEPGIWQVVRQREFDPASQPRQHAD